MGYTIIRDNQDGVSMLERDTVTGAPFLSIRRMRGAADYLDYYRLSDQELALFMANPDRLAAFTKLADERQMEERLVRPDTGASGARPVPQPLYVSYAPRYSLDRNSNTGEAIFSIPVSTGPVDYEEWYRISEDELRLFLGHPELAEAFAKCCGRHEFDARLILKPGTNRGHYTG